MFERGGFALEPAPIIGTRRNRPTSVSALVQKGKDGSGQAHRTGRRFLLRVNVFLRKMAGFDQHLIDVFSGHDFTVDQERIDFIATVVAQF